MGMAAISGRECFASVRCPVRGVSACPKSERGTSTGSRSSGVGSAACGAHEPERMQLEPRSVDPGTSPVQTPDAEQGSRAMQQAP